MRNNRCCYVNATGLVLFWLLISNFLVRRADPFAEESIDKKKADAKDYVHIRVQQRNGKKSLTTVQGLPSAFDLKKILKALKKGMLTGFFFSLYRYKSYLLCLVCSSYSLLRRVPLPRRCDRCLTITPSLSFNVIFSTHISL